MIGINRLMRSVNCVKSIPVAEAAFALQAHLQTTSSTGSQLDNSHMRRTPVMNGCIPPRKSRLFRSHTRTNQRRRCRRWDVTSAAVVSGLECYRLTIGTTEHSVIGHSGRGIPSFWTFPQPLTRSEVAVRSPRVARVTSPAPRRTALYSASPRMRGACDK